MKLMIVRHGETIENKKRIWQGRLHGTLSEEGVIQARKLALRFSEENLDYIYSSDLRRALNTAKEIAKYHPNIPFYTNEKIREASFGNLEGEFISETNINLESSGIESIESMQKRARSFIKMLKKYPENSTIMVVGHGMINRAITSILLDKSYKEIPHYYNAGVSIFEIKKKKNPVMYLFNCTEHLTV